MSCNKKDYMGSNQWKHTERKDYMTLPGDPGRWKQYLFIIDKLKCLGYVSFN